MNGNNSWSDGSPTTDWPNATDGFFYTQSCAGAPSGVPTSKTGRVPTVVDTTNGRAYFYYGGGWHYTTLT